MKIKCRFRNQSDFNNFAQKTGYSISENTKEFCIDTGNCLTKNQTHNRITEKTFDKHWKNMPRFECNGKECYATIIFEFKNVDNASVVFNQKITEKTKSIWYPVWERGLHEKN